MGECIAAVTEVTNENYPGFINLSRVEGGVRVEVRSNEQRDEHGCGKQVSLLLSEEDWALLRSEIAAAVR